MDTAATRRGGSRHGVLQGVVYAQQILGVETGVGGCRCPPRLFTVLRRRMGRPSTIWGRPRASNHRCIPQKFIFEYLLSFLCKVARRGPPFDNVLR